MPGRSLTAARGRRLHFELLDDRRMLAAGVTVITHGAQFSFFGTATLPEWPIAIGQAILDRADGTLTSQTVGSMFKHDFATGQWVPVGATAWSNSNQPTDHIVLIYDWAAESAFFEDGWLEAAADNLFANLLATNANLAGGLQGVSFFDAALAAGGGGGLLDLHLIGHSRGGVLNSLVAERFDHYFGELTIDQVTTLDAHPASSMSDPGYVSTNPSLNSRVFTYDNVRFSDNYYQQDGNYEPISLTPDFDGVVANGAYNLLLPSAVLENGGSSLEHSDVHSWYYGTITQPFVAGYSGVSGSGRNNDGDVAFPDAWWGSSGVPARESTGFSFSQIGGASRNDLPTTGAKIPAASVPTVFNGDFAVAINQSTDSVQGWQWHADNGTAPLGGSNLYIELIAGGEDYFRRHNLLYLPRHTVAVEYDYWISDDDSPQPDDQLQVRVGGVLVDSIPLGQVTNGFVPNRRAAFALPTVGLAATIEFMIADVLDDNVESAVRIDNVELVIQQPAASADFDGDVDVDGGDFLRWQRGLGTFVVAKHEGGDADFDGNVLGDDLAAWRTGYGKPSSGGAAAVSSLAWANDLLIVATNAAIVEARPAATVDRNHQVDANLPRPGRTTYELQSESIACDDFSRAARPNVEWGRRGSPRRRDGIAGSALGDAAWDEAFAGLAG